MWTYQRLVNQGLRLQTVQFRARQTFLLLLLQLFAAAAHSQSGPVGWWKFEEGSGTTTADSSGHANTGTLVNSPSWVAGHVGSGALTFNGTTNYVNVPNASGSLDNLQVTTMTVAAWIKPTGAGGGGGGRIIEKDGWFFAMSTVSGHTVVRLTCQDTGGFRSSTAITLNSWAHVAATWDGAGPGSGMHVYVNGVLADDTSTAGTNAGSGTPANNDIGSASIGNRADDSARGFAGTIDDLRVYNRTLSPTEISALTDLTAPGAPGTLSISGTTSTQAALSWGAATDNVAVTSYLIERCSGSATCTSFAQVATSTSIAYTDTGLTASTIYRYRVRATDANGNLGAYSNIANTTTTAGSGDVTPPSAPGALSFTVNSGTQVTVAWGAANDNVGVTGYQIDRCSGSGCTTFSPAGSVVSSPFVNTGLTGNTVYVYRVRATDAAGNAGPYSTGTVTTPAVDNQAPSAPGVTAAAVISSNKIEVSWVQSTDNTSVQAYWIERCQGVGCSNFAQIAATNATAFVDSGLLPSTSYTYRIRAVDPSANLSTYSVTATNTTAAPTAGSVNYDYDHHGRLHQASYGDSSSIVFSLDAAGNRLSTTVPDTLAPRAPGIPVISAIAAASATATWNPAADEVAVVVYEYQLSGQTSWTAIGNVTTFNLTGLTPQTPYTFSVHAKDAAGNTSATSTSASFTTLADTTPPQAPGVPTFTNIATSSATMTWTAATDDVGVTGYEYSLNAGTTWVTAGNVLTTTLTGLTANTSYTVQLRAKDAAGHSGAVSTGTFQTPADTQKPTKPGVPTISNVAYNAATAAWTSATDNVGVTAYEYQVNTSSTTGLWVRLGNVLTVNITGLSPVTQYTVAVHALDAALNTGDAAVSLPFTTPQDPIPPSAPGVPQFSSITMTQAVVSWAPATDNIAVTSYEYDVNGSGSWINVGNVTQTTVTGLIAHQSYAIRVRAKDQAGNPGTPSSGSFMTPDTQPPTAPGVPVVSAVAQTTATVSWSAASDNVSVVRYQYSLTNPASAGWTNAGNVLSINLTGLTPGTPYPISIAAVDEVGLVGPVSSSSFTTTTYTDTPVLTVGGPISTNQGASGGFISGSYGSMSPSTTSTGRSYQQFTDQYASPMAGGGFLQSRFAVGGFSSDPGQAWLTSAGFAGGSTLSGSTATYSYSGGVATWTWTSAFGIGAGTKNCTIVHR